MVILNIVTTAISVVTVFVNFICFYQIKKRGGKTVE